MLDDVTVIAWASFGRTAINNGAARSLAQAVCPAGPRGMRTGQPSGSTTAWVSPNISGPLPEIGHVLPQPGVIFGHHVV